MATKQIRIPQQWNQLGYETTGWNGEWRDAAKLIKVDKSPVTREWTADPNTGTSNRNEAIWVMTSDQVEFSTGWTCTARIAMRDDAVKFLHNNPSGSLQSVMDTEVRAKLQAEFGLEVTDLPMDELRKNATPHLKRVVAELTRFFSERGITITNLGITGGFVYKDKAIQDMLVKVFNAEQEKSIAIAKTQSQMEENKRVLLEADGKAKAILAQKKAEPDGIKAVADANAYEITKAKEDLVTYLKLKQIELESRRTEKWDGRFPVYYMGTAGSTPICCSRSQPGRSRLGQVNRPARGDGTDDVPWRWALLGEWGSSRRSAGEPRADGGVHDDHATSVSDPWSYVNSMKNPGHQAGVRRVKGAGPSHEDGRGVRRTSLLLPALVARLAFQSVLLFIDHGAQGRLFGVERA